MSRYIDAEALKQKKVYSAERHEYIVPVAEIDWQPTVDVVEVRHGEWIPPQLIGRCRFYNIKEFNCSLCGESFWVADGHKNMHYCPNCGAKMDGERK